MSEEQPKKKNCGTKRGRPTKLTPQVSKSVCDFIRLGSCLEVAAQAAGVTRTTLYDWIGKGNQALEAIEQNWNPQEGTEPYIKFVQDVRVAAAEAELLDIERIDKAAENGVWQAAAWKLERRHQDRYALKKEKDQTPPPPTGITLQEGQVMLDLADLPLEVREALLDHLRAKKATKNAGNQ